MITFTAEPVNGAYRVAKREPGKPITYRAAFPASPVRTYNYSSARDVVAYLTEDPTAHLSMHWREA